jgi:RarD protein
MDKKELFAKMKLCGSMAIFGSIGIFVKFLTLPSGFLVFLRASIGVLFLLPFVIFGKNKFNFGSIKKNLLPLLLSGAALGANWVLLFEAYGKAGVPTATVCYYMALIFVILTSPLVLRERLTAKKLICVGIALAGMLLVTGLFGNNDGGDSLFLGILLGLGAAVLYATVILLNKKLKCISAHNRTFMQLGTAALVVLPYSLLVEDIKPESFTPTVLILLACVGILHTGVAYLAYFGAMKSLPAQTVAIFSYVDPAVALLLSPILLGQFMDIPQLIGAILILAGAFVREIDFRRRRKNADR